MHGSKVPTNFDGAAFGATLNHLWHIFVMWGTFWDAEWVQAQVCQNTSGICPF